MLAGKEYWDATFASEAMMQVDLPAATMSNGTWLKTQSLHSFVRSMISREDTWHPRCQ